MKNWKKRALSLLMTAAMLAVVLCTGAVAAPAETTIGVEINGEAVTFTDAVPEAQAGRTFLPFRAVFEALGADVDFDSETKAVSATRGDVTVNMVVGAKEATVTQGGVSVTLPMDVAAYAANDRTYVPVRFAAQALGCNVGWDNTSKTVILVDTAALIEEAVKDAEFTLMEKYAAYAAKFNQGTWDMSAKMSMLVSMMATQIMTMDGTVTGVVADANSGEVSMNLKMDMTGLMTMMAQMSGVTLEEMLTVSEMTSADLKMDMDMDMRMDLEAGKLYLLISGLPEDSGLSADTWLSMDLNELLAGSGMDLAQLMTMGQSFDAASTIAVQTALLNLDNKDTAYELVTNTVNSMVNMLSDDAFVKDGLTYTNTMDLSPVFAALKLTTNTAGDVVAYEMDADLSVKLADMGLDTSSLSAMGMDTESLEVSVKAAMDANDAMTMTLKLDLGTTISAEMTMEGKYTASTKTPNTEPPAGATVVDYAEWMARQTVSE